MFDFNIRKGSNQIVKTIYSKLRIKRYIYLIGGLLCISLAFNIFFLPNNIVFGGISGLSIITKKYFHWEPSVFILISSVLLLIISYFVLGPEKTRWSILGSMLFPIFVKLTERVPLYLNFKSNDLLLCSVFGGILYGIGAGLIFKAGFTTGGTDIINQIISKHARISIGTSLLLCEGLIVLCGGFVFGILKLMYSLITLYMISTLTDKVMLGISDSKAFYIIAEEAEEIKKYILNELGHGVTIFDAKGGFKKEKQKVLFCVIPTKEYFKMKEGIHEIDSDAFFVVVDAYEVLGGE